MSAVNVNGGRLWMGGAAVLAFFFAVAVFLQTLGGAYRAELTGYWDESAHLVTGIMTVEYLRTFPPVFPVHFAKEFYIHRPMVAIGHWPPMFYVLEGFWFLVVGVSRSSVLLLMALISAAVATTLYRMMS